MRPRSSSYVGIATFPLAVLALHQLRYLLAYGSGAEQALQAQGHAYFSALAPLMVVTLACGAGAYLGRLSDHWRGARVEPVVRTRRLWLACALALVAVYMTQETLEGWFATGHPGGLDGVFGNGGWWSLPLAGVLGGVLALLMRGGRRVARAVAETAAETSAITRRIGTLRIRARAVPAFALLERSVGAIGAPLALCAAERGPPRASLAHA